MSDDDFFDRLRDDAQQLRYQPQDDVLWTRLAARIRERVQAQPSVSQLLAGWFRPITASLTALALAAVVGVTWDQRTHDAQGYTLEAMSTPSMEITVDGDTYNLAE